MEEEQENDTEEVSLDKLEDLTVDVTKPAYQVGFKKDIGGLKKGNYSKIPASWPASFCTG